MSALEGRADQDGQVLPARAVTAGHEVRPSLSVGGIGRSKNPEPGGPGGVTATAVGGVDSEWMSADYVPRGRHRGCTGARNDIGFHAGARNGTAPSLNFENAADAVPFLSPGVTLIHGGPTD